MIFKYTATGQKRLAIGEWYSLEKWPHSCPAELYHAHFIILRGGREYRCGPAVDACLAQVSALIYRAESEKDNRKQQGDHYHE